MLTFPNLSIEPLLYPQFVDDLRFFETGETIYVTEKIPGIEARFVYHERHDYVGNKFSWLANEPENELHWGMHKQYPGLLAYTRANPGHVIHATMYEDKMAIFSIYDALSGQYLTTKAWRGRMQFSRLPVVDLLGSCQWAPGVFEEDVVPFLTGHSKHRQGKFVAGLILTPERERFYMPTHNTFQRVAFKHEAPK